MKIGCVAKFLHLTCAFRRLGGINIYLHDVGMLHEVIACAPVCEESSGGTQTETPFLRLVEGEELFTPRGVGRINPHCFIVYLSQTYNLIKIIGVAPIEKFAERNDTTGVVISACCCPC